MQAERTNNVNIVNKFDTQEFTQPLKASDWNIDENGELFHYVDNETSNGYFFDFPHDEI